MKVIANEPIKLRDDLLLGVATASSQIEGGISNNNWYEWTKNGDVTPDKTTPLVANDHYNELERDLNLMKETNVQVYRLSLEWGRIEPEEGVFNEEALEHYVKEITMLKERGILPLVTLHHFSNPMWFELKGGWLAKSAPTDFLLFAKKVVDKFNGLVKEYCTINEPNVYATNCYLLKLWYPCIGSFKAYCKVLKNFTKAHIETFKYIKEVDKEAKVGFANHIAYFVPQKKKNPLNRFITAFYDRGFNTAITKAMLYGKYVFPLGFIGHKKGLFADYIGINYYALHEIRGFGNFAKKEGPHNDLGWSIYPEGLKIICEKYHQKYNNLDIFITENGTADRDDLWRTKYIYDHVRLVNELPYVKRYCHWTFLDNWEWAEGETARFGLYGYDSKTKVITVRDSAKFFKEMIATRGVTEEMISKYLKGSKYHD